MAECHPSKVDVAGSNPVSRSNTDQWRRTNDGSQPLSSFVLCLTASHGLVAQWQSSALIRRGLLVRVQPGPHDIADFGLQIAD